MLKGKVRLEIKLFFDHSKFAQLLNEKQINYSVFLPNLR